MIASTPVNPGKLDRRVALIYPVKTRSAAGAELISWVESGSVWAGWTAARGDELQQSDQKLPIADGILRIRYRVGITSEWRISMGGTLLEIVAPPIEVGRREYIDLLLRSTGSAAPTAVNVRLLHDLSPVLQHDNQFDLLHTSLLEGRLMHDGSEAKLHDGSPALLESAA